MKTKKLLSIGIVTGLLGWLGYSKYKEVSRLKDIDFAPGAKPFRFIDLSHGIAKFVVGLVIDNPSTINVAIDSLKVEAFYKGSYLGMVNTVQITLPAQTKKPLDLPLTVIASKIIPFTKDFLTTGKIPVLFKVAAVINVLGKPVTVPYELTIDVKDALRDYLKQSQPLIAKLM